VKKITSNKISSNNIVPFFGTLYYLSIWDDNFSKTWTESKILVLLNCVLQEPLSLFHCRRDGLTRRALLYWNILKNTTINWKCSNNWYLLLTFNMNNHIIRDVAFGGSDLIKGRQPDTWGGIWWQWPYKRETTVIPHISIFYDYFYILQFFSAKRIQNSLTIWKCSKIINITDPLWQLKFPSYML
jgi:hypothetical protein